MSKSLSPPAIRWGRKPARKNDLNLYRLAASTNIPIFLPETLNSCTDIFPLVFAPSLKLYFLFCTHIHNDVT